MKNTAIKDKVDNKIGFKNIKNISSSILLNALYRAAVINNMPVALWKEYGNNSIYCLVSLNDPEIKNVSFNSNDASFVFSPFDNNDSQNNFILKKDILLDLNKRTIECTNELNNEESNKIDKFIQCFNQYLDNYIPVSYNSKQNFVPENNYTKEEFCNLVNKAINNIKSGRTKKIVVSRTKDIKIPEKFDIINFFEKLALKYNNAFVSLVNVPQIGTWIGATPETLLKVTDQELLTMSVAGTQTNSGNLSKIKWSHKEIQEQRLVSEYIEYCFSQSGVTNYIEEAPHTLDAGKVVHLKTLFKYSSTNAKDIADNFLKLMHPTPAVCGLPKKEAKSFLLENEIHNRKFYTGFLGTININQGVSELFVNLRCMQIKEDKAIIYVGCGITEDSIPENEWNETEMKAEVLLSVMNNE
ncbi:MAG: isochorismate synthase [Candidatus Sericytochromatia bacterium]|nr:isochorismate synthase [Candidatus Sericytochromatia bacterium]